MVKETNEVNSSRLVNFCGALVNLNCWIAFTSVLTIFALFNDDVRTGFLSPKFDTLFDVLTSIVIVVFLLEIIILVIGRPKYLWSFFFILDVVSTITLLLDISFVNTALFSSGSANTSAEVTQTSRAGRAGSKAARIIKVVRLVRLIRVFKVVTSIQTYLFPEPELEDLGIDSTFIENSSLENEEESRVGKMLSSYITRHIIILVLVMLIVIPFFQPDADYGESPAIIFDSLKLAHSLLSQENILLKLISDFADSQTRSTSGFLIFISYPLISITSLATTEQFWDLWYNNNISERTRDILLGRLPKDICMINNIEVTGVVLKGATEELLCPDNYRPQQLQNFFFHQNNIDSEIALVRYYV